MTRRALLVLPLAWGCDEATYETTVFPDHEYHVFNEALPDAIEEIHDTCHLDLLAPGISYLELEAGSGSMDLTGSLCTTSSGLSSVAADVWDILNSEGPISYDFDPTFDDSLQQAYSWTGETFTFGAFSWGTIDLTGIHVFCNVDMTFDMQAESIGFSNLDARWVNDSAGRGGMEVSLDGIDTHAVASGTIISDATCNGVFIPFLVWVPGAIVSLAVEAKLPQGYHEIWFTDATLDTTITFDAPGGNDGDAATDGFDVVGTATPDFSLARLRLDPPLSDMVKDGLGSFEDLVEDKAGITPANIGAEVESAVQEPLQDLADDMASSLYLTALLLEGGTGGICNIWSTGDDALIMSTSDDCY